jgi:hypothetical protein
MIIQINYVTSSLYFLFKGKLSQEKRNQFQRIDKNLLKLNGLLHFVLKMTSL